ncbi:exo-beta-N-acetylmuramidase NamZ domain-containing protein [Limnochorda pilosa]|uniref:Uncharacterized protein n=1 Tax=Limnochorda pilosa TaxID=1555112 RepID=A0A0K2SMR7_LIMPI|nr:exo-beta-N-acetylmuramidase NamZ domain-containing protein [Limnochorda pilosa]BAS28297.1 hypothetical protein LIP_2456 [Limnochorda pilosa]
MSAQRRRVRPLSALIVLGILLLSAKATRTGSAESPADLPPVLRPASRATLNTLDLDALEDIDALIADGIRQAKFPGAVVLVARDGAVLKWEAYGDAYTYGPDGEPMAWSLPMTRNSVFDLASLTKLFTATAVMQLVERGKVDLDAPVATYLPTFGSRGKEEVTVRQLLTHTSGLPAWAPFYKDQPDPEARIRSLLEAGLESDPGTKYVYSDLGFVTLGLLVEAASGQPLDRYVAEHIAEPLGLRQTRYNPPSEWRPWIAATEAQPWTGRPMIWGEVHDENAWSLSGVSGHAGLFSSARDLAVFLQTLLNGGTYAGRRILQPATVEEMLRDQLGSELGPHGLGWELSEPWYMGAFADTGGAFGHTGYTGTSVVADRSTGTLVIVLTNRVHPTRENGSINPWRRGVADLVARAAGLIGSLRRPQEEAPEGEIVTLGIDVLLEDPSILKGKRVGVITNPTGINRVFRSVVDLLHEHPDIDLAAVFGPEHGFRGAEQAGARVGDQTDPVTGLPVYSLYGETRKPTAEMLEGLDVLVFDIQDVGVHFYTYVSTMAYAMEAAAEHGLEFVVLDRPNPIGGLDVQGPVIQEGYTSFIGVYPMPIRHGMTVGELAWYFNDAFDIDAELTVVPMKSWRRGEWYDQTGLPTWVMPSPNMPTLDTAIVYPGTALLEGTNLSEGRGTTRPFELIGAPFVDAEAFARYLNGRGLPGVVFRPTSFTPTFSKYPGEVVHGVQLHVTDRDRFDPVRAGIEILVAARRLYPDRFQIDRPEHFDLLTGDPSVRLGIENGASADIIEAAWQRDLEAFKQIRDRYLIYQDR